MKRSSTITVDVRPSKEIRLSVVIRHPPEPIVKWETDGSLKNMIDTIMLCSKFYSSLVAQKPLLSGATFNRVYKSLNNLYEVSHRVGEFCYDFSLNQTQKWVDKGINLDVLSSNVKLEIILQGIHSNLLYAYNFLGDDCKMWIEFFNGAWNDSLCLEGRFSDIVDWCIRKGEPGVSDYTLLTIEENIVLYSKHVRREVLSKTKIGRRIIKLEGISINTHELFKKSERNVKYTLDDSDTYKTIVWLKASLNETNKTLLTLEDEIREQKVYDKMLLTLTSRLEGKTSRDGVITRQQIIDVFSCLYGL